MRSKLNRLVKFVKSQSKRNKIIVAGTLLTLVVSSSVYALNQNNSNPVISTKNESLNHDEKVEAASTSNHASDSDEKSEEKNTGDTGNTQKSNSTSIKNNDGTLSTPVVNPPSPYGNNPKVTWAAFIGARVYCSNGAQIASIDNMRVYALSIPRSGLTITWKWESSLPSLNYDIDNIVRTTTFPAGETNYLVLPQSQVFTHLYSASSWDAGSFGGIIPAHCVRIKILTPNVVTTPWFAIPEFSTTVHPCS